MPHSSPTHQPTWLLDLKVLFNLNLECGTSYKMSSKNVNLQGVPENVHLRFWLISQWKHSILLLHPNGFFSVYIRDHFEYWTIHGGCIEPEIFLSKVGATRYHIMENTLKVDDFQKSVLICKYLRNKSSDLYEILNLSFCVSNELLQKFWWRSVSAHTCTSCKRAHMRWS